MTTQERIDNLLPDPRETARSIHRQAIALSDQYRAKAHLIILQSFVGPAQLACVRDGLRGEESTFFAEKMKELAAVVEAMPKTYEQEGLGDSAIAYLHYFTRNFDCWITEKDAGEPAPAVFTGQHQAFGLSSFGYEAELGYISLPEILAAGAELDFHFTPKTIGEIKASLEAKAA